MSDLIVDATGNDLTYRIIGAAMAVHNYLGPGYRELVYERAMAVELASRDISAMRQYPVQVHFQDQSIATFYLDFFVEDLVVVELKAIWHQLTNDEVAQVINYLKATQSPVGLLFNFGRRRLGWKRILPSREDGPVQRIGRSDRYSTWRREDPPPYIPASKRKPE
jgi:GxxExxY protein